MTTQELFQKMTDKWHFEPLKHEIEYCEKVIEDKGDDPSWTRVIKSIHSHLNIELVPKRLMRCQEDLKEWTKTSGNPDRNLTGTQATFVSPK